MITAICDKNTDTNKTRTKRRVHPIIASLLILYARTVRLINAYKRKTLQKLKLIKHSAPAKTYMQANIFIPKYNLIFISIPKVACSSVKSVLYELQSGTKPMMNIHDAPFTYIPFKQLVFYPNCFIFAFVRNPWDRIVSLYANKIKSDPDYNDRDENDEQFSNGAAKWFACYGGIFRGGMTFAEFVQAIAVIPDEESNNHFRSQYLFITDKHNATIVDFLGKFEHLTDDFNTLKNLAGLPTDTSLPHKMKSEHSDYRLYYTEELKGLVAQRYKRDIEQFDYSF